MSAKTPSANIDFGVTLEGTIEAVRVIKTKSGMPMAFVVIECADGPAEVIFFPGTYARYSEVLREGGKINVEVLPNCNEKGDIKYLVDNVLKA